jgi:uncharacterized protein DUF4382
LQFRPQGIFPSQGTIEIKLTAGDLVAALADQVRPSGDCGGNCNATSLNVTITMIEVHTSGIDNMTGAWTPVCNKPLTVDISKVTSMTQFLCGHTFQSDTITNLRLTVSTVVALISGQTTPRTLSLPSGKLEVPVDQATQIEAGKTTIVIIEFQPHIVHTGNGGDYKLTPVLHTVTVGPS